MYTINLGESGLKISPVIVGCMSYGDKKWLDWVVEDEQEVFKILKKCYDLGLRTFDTADVYSNGVSEILLGKFIKHYNISRDKVVILSKCFFPTSPGKSFFDIKDLGYDFDNSRGLSRKHIFDAVHASVERLGTYIDVLQIHRLDHSTPKVEIMRALNDVVLLGSVRYIGASAMKTFEFAELQYIADKHGWFKFISMQNYYNLLYREEEREMIPFCNNSVLGRVGVIPYSPTARGVLAKPLGDESAKTYRSESDKIIDTYNLRLLTDKEQEILRRTEEIAKSRGFSMANVAQAWLMSKGCAPIVGLSSEKRVEDTVRSVELKLTEEEVKYLEEPYVAVRPMF